MENVSTTEIIISFIANWGDRIIPFLSLVVSIISLHKSSKAEKLQNQVNELELKLKQYEIDKIEKEQKEALSACVEARVIRIAQGKYRMIVWNSGNASAYNVTAKFEGNPQIIIMDQEKQPFEVLDGRKNYELTLIVHSGSDSKFKIKTTWTDINGQTHTKTQMGDL